MQREFPFPFTPYENQIDFMNNLYDCIDNGKIGIFESPTGTGKSLSIICSALYWLREQRIIETSVNVNIESTKNDSLPDWIFDQTNDINYKKITKRIEIRNRQKDRFKTMKSIPNPKPISFQPKKIKRKMSSENENDPIDTLEKAQDSEDEVESDCVKIFYCSRTHSQISQFVNEIKSTEYGDMRVVILGSRKQTCINKNVNTKNSPTSIVNNRCLDLQEEKSASKRCPFKNLEGLMRFRDKTLSNISDIESLLESGLSLNTCAYYGSRRAIKSADIIALPYTSLMHQDTRESLGIDLDKSVIIVDEAHNLIDALSQMNSVVLTVKNLHQAILQLNTYYKEYKSKYLERKMYKYNTNIQNLLSVMEKMRNLFTKEMSIYSIVDFSSKLGIENQNPHDLDDFLRDSNLIPQIAGYYVRYFSSHGQLGIDIDEEFMDKSVNAATTPLRIVQQLLSTLIVRNDDGRYFCDSQNIKFVLMNPSRGFQKVVKQCRSIVLAGGTIKPIKLFETMLFGNTIQESDIHKFSCGHVVSPNQLKPIFLGTGPSGKVLNFSYKGRNTNPNDLMRELALFFVDLCKIVPSGIVVFLPSYSFAEEFNSFWEREFGEWRNTKKKVIFELRKNYQEILKDFKEAIDFGQGALLFSVVGGRLSEGINFKDSLCRAVVVVGMPYPNYNDPIFQERLNYLCENEEMKREMSDNMCMKQVNQSIGRAIRHQNDWASFILLDERYISKPKILEKIPNWLSSRVEKFGSKSKNAFQNQSEYNTAKQELLKFISAMNS